MLGKLLGTATGTAETILLSEMLKTLLSIWKETSTGTQSRKDDPIRSFASHCLVPCLAVLNLLQSPKFSDQSFISSKKAMERLVAMQFVLPTRSMFNERFARKWRSKYDVLVYEHLEALLQAFKDRILPREDKESQTLRSMTSLTPLDLSWMILDIAIRLLPSSDFQKRQSEQPWIDTLFLCLVHLLWPWMPQITLTGVVQPPRPKISDQITPESPLPDLESLVDVVLARKFRISLPVLGYILSAVVAMEEPSTPWILLVKIVQIDVNILIPSPGVPRSENFLQQVLVRLEAESISTGTYQLVRDSLILPLLRSYAQSRNIDRFITIWQQNLAEAMRIRYTSKDDPQSIPAVLVWDDEDVFDQFKDLVLLHAPPSLGQRLLGGLLQPVSELGEKVGSSADTFAKLAIFSAFLEISRERGAKMNLDPNQLGVLFDGAMAALPRKSDYQAQRWRLWKFLRLLVDRGQLAQLSSDLERLMRPDHRFLSLSAITNLDQADPSRKKASRFLECLECFTVAVWLAAESPLYQSVLKAEVQSLTNVIAESGNSQHSDDDHVLWNGRGFECDSIVKLLAACIGRLLQRPELFSRYPDTFEKFIDQSIGFLTRGSPAKAQGEASPYIAELFKAVLQVDEVVTTPALQKAIIQRVFDRFEGEAVPGNADNVLLQMLSVDAATKPQLKKLAAGTMRRLPGADEQSDAKALVDDLALLIRVDAVLKGSIIKPGDWQTWIEFSRRLFKLKNQDLSINFLTATEMLVHVFETLWDRAVAAPKPTILTEILFWTKETIETTSEFDLDESFILVLQVFLGQSRRSKSELDIIMSSQTLQHLREKFALMVSLFIGPFINPAPRINDLLELKLCLDATSRVSAADSTTWQNVAASIRTWLQATRVSRDDRAVVLHEQCLALSIQRECLQLSNSSSVKPTKEEISELIQNLVSSAKLQSDWTNGNTSLLSSSGNVFVGQMSPAGWPLLLETLRKSNKNEDVQLIRPIVTASVLLHIEKSHVSEDPGLADELAKIADLASCSECYTVRGLHLTLENCRTVLQLHPLVVNQSTLDRLLASLATIASASDDDALPVNSVGDGCGPQAADVYHQICAVMGALLGRHRKRISDRYHLILPVMQKLLRCLFWPGADSVQAMQRSPISNAINTFGKTLPKWIHESGSSLPPASAEHFSRLVSSICNPTVAGARSSKKRSRNELNDETKMARQLAGQHMQYLVMEYARCCLEAQLLQPVRDRLMPGMYSVMDSMDTKLLRALNAGMDPSSRAIFKHLYDDWTRFGKWDKS